MHFAKAAGDAFNACIFYERELFYGPCIYSVWAPSCNCNMPHSRYYVSFIMSALANPLIPTPQHHRAAFVETLTYNALHDHAPGGRSREPGIPAPFIQSE